MKSWPVFASWAYLAVALFGLIVPLIWNMFKSRGSFLGEDAANEFEWLCEEARKRLNFHLNREKYSIGGGLSNGLLLFSTTAVPAR